MADQNWMLFHEVYGSYYNTVAKILERAVTGGLNRREVLDLVYRYAFAESWQGLTESLLNGDWPFLDENMKTELRYIPNMPLTTLQQRWLKTLLQDPRIHLFLDPGEVSLPEEVLPLFAPEDIVYFDRYQDPDDYGDPDYIRNFRTVLEALRQKAWLEVTYRNRDGSTVTGTVNPLHLEYSPRDDKFRLHCAGILHHPRQSPTQFNMARILYCRKTDASETAAGFPTQQKRADLILTDRLDLLERFMRLFCYLEKRTVPMDEEGDVRRYSVQLYYDPTDESELVIRLLSMGNHIRVLAPETLRREIADRIQRQRSLFQSE